MFTDKLFDHKYDIDDLITAFCAGSNSEKWRLNTRTGEIKPININEIVEDGSDNNHVHIIESLPISFLNELTCNAKFNKLPDETKDEVKEIIASVSTISELAPYFESGDAGSYIVKAVKGACLDWLDMRNLIPPSMRHTGDLSMFGSLGNNGDKIKVKVSIT
tara:strand:- start:85132 stop:85617 length:486 start_codon:yes stop_codon:yes gene_type:complete